MLDDLQKRELRALYISHDRESRTKVAQHAHTRHVILVCLEGAPEMGDRFGGLASRVQDDSEHLVGARFGIAVPQAFGVEENVAQRIFGVEQVPATPERV